MFREFSRHDASIFRIAESLKCFCRTSFRKGERKHRFLVSKCDLWVHSVKNGRAAVRQRSTGSIDVEKIFRRHSVDRPDRKSRFLPSCSWVERDQDVRKSGDPGFLRVRDLGKLCRIEFGIRFGKEISARLCIDELREAFFQFFMRDFPLCVEPEEFIFRSVEIFLDRLSGSEDHRTVSACTDADISEFREPEHPREIDDADDPVGSIARRIAFSGKLKLERIADPQPAVFTEFRGHDTDSILRFGRHGQACCLAVSFQESEVQHRILFRVGEIRIDTHQDDAWIHCTGILHFLAKRFFQLRLRDGDLHEFFRINARHSAQCRGRFV